MENKKKQATHYMDGHSGTLPSDEALEPHLKGASQTLQWAMQDLEEKEDIAKGWRTQILFRDRFNLGPEDFNLVVQRQHGALVEHLRDPYASTWRAYCRSVLVRGAFFKVVSSSSSVTFYVNENKVLAGGERRGKGDAVGRNLVLTFFEDIPDHPGLLRRLERDGGSMHPRQMTLAELVQACGVILPCNPDRTSAESERLLEEAWATLDLRRFSGNLETESLEVHTYSLSEEANAEDAFVQDEPFESLTKVALARFLERMGGPPRRTGWQRNLQDLREEVRPRLLAEGPRRVADEPSQAAPKAKAKGAAKRTAKAVAKGRNR